MKTLLGVVFTLLLTQAINAATYYTRSDGNWSTTNGGSSCGCTPTSSDDLNVNHDVNPDFNIGTGSITFSGSLTINSGGKFYHFGSITFSAASSVTINSGGTLDLDGSIVNSSSSFTVDGTLDMWGATNNGGSINGSGTIIWAGSFANNGTINGSTDNPVSSPIDLSTLPVELIAFSGELSDNEIELTWSTASEINNDYFIVERSVDGINFSAYLSVGGSGDSQSIINYSAIDKKPFHGNNYYRLKQVDYNGDFAYSNVIQVNFLPQPKVYYDASSEVIRVISNSRIDVEIFDLHGKAVYVGENNEINASSFSIGTYIVRIGDGSNSYHSIKLVVH